MMEIKRYEVMKLPGMDREWGSSRIAGRGSSPWWDSGARKCPLSASSMEPQSTCLVPIPGLLIHSINQNNSITPKSSVDLRGANSISMILCHNPDQGILIPGSSHDTVTRYFPFRWSRSACSYVVFVWLYYCKPRFLYCFFYIYKFSCKSIDIYHRPALILSRCWSVRWFPKRWVLLTRC